MQDQWRIPVLLPLCKNTKKTARKSAATTGESLFSASVSKFLKQFFLLDTVKPINPQLETNKTALEKREVVATKSLPSDNSLSGETSQMN